MEPQLLALLVFSLAGKTLLAGVSPGAAVGWVEYPNGSIAGFVAYAGGAALLYPGYAVLDYLDGYALLVGPGGLVYYATPGGAYAVAPLRKTLPPKQLLPGGYAVVGNMLVYPNGSALVLPPGYTPVAPLPRGYAADTPRGLLIVEGGRARLYPGIHGVNPCGDALIVAVNGSVGVLRDGELTLYVVRGAGLEWGGTLDFSVAACIPGGVAYTTRYRGSAAVVIATGRYCRVVYTTPPAEAAGVDANETSITVAFNAPGRVEVKTSNCTVEVVAEHVEPVSVEPPRVHTLRLEAAHAPAPLEARVGAPTPVSENIVLLVYGLGGGPGAPAPRAPRLVNAALAAVLAAVVLAALAALWRRVGGVRSSAR